MTIQQIRAQWEREYKQEYPDRDEKEQILAFVRMCLALEIDMQGKTYREAHLELRKAWKHDDMEWFLSLGQKLKNLTIPEGEVIQ